MNKIILTIGISNSGKTTWVNELCQLGLVNLNRDALRADHFTKSGNLSDYKYTKQKEKDITKMQFTMATNYADLGYTIVVSDTNLNPETRQRWLEWASENNYLYEEKVFDVEPHTCKNRNIKREYSVPPHVIDQQYLQMRKYLGLPTTYEYQAGLKESIIIDLDGTVADMVGVRQPFDWDKVGQDKRHQDIIDLVETLNDSGLYPIFLSGRDGICERDTRIWINQNLDVNFGYKLFMREAGDMRADSIVKEELFDKHIRGKYNVKYVIDDRDQVVQRWRAMGLRVLQVANGSF